MQRIHITLGKGVLNNPTLLEEVKQRIIAMTGMTAINEKRLQRYGILTGIVDSDKIPLISGVREVVSIDADEVRRATG